MQSTIKCFRNVLVWAHSNLADFWIWLLIFYSRCYNVRTPVNFFVMFVIHKNFPIVFRCHFPTWFSTRDWQAKCVSRCHVEKKKLFGFSFPLPISFSICLVEFLLIFGNSKVLCVQIGFWQLQFAELAHKSLVGSSRRTSQEMCLL
jgi:hypothetical protein